MARRNASAERPGRPPGPALTTWSARRRAPPVFHGEGGFSPKTADGNAGSLYFSQTRMGARARSTARAKPLAVTGDSWLDREIFTSTLAADQIGWDWVALQLDDGRDLMLYRLRDARGPEDFALGTLVEPDGTSRAPCPPKPGAWSRRTTGPARDTGARIPGELEADGSRRRTSTVDSRRRCPTRKTSRRARASTTGKGRSPCTPGTIRSQPGPWFRRTDRLRRRAAGRPSEGARHRDCDMMGRPMNYTNRRIFMTTPIRIGVSACLLGQKVRYDGGHKHNRYLTDVLADFFELVSVCPEAEVGMGTPRETVRLEGDLEAPHMMAPRSGKDWTAR